MSGTFLIKPSFNRINRQIKFPTKSLNAFANARLVDCWSFYQRQFGLYNFMPLTKDFKYKLHTLQGQPFMWQKHVNCGWDDTGSLKMDVQELTPCRAKINESWCYDELFNSCFSHFLAIRNKKIELDANGTAVVNSLVQHLSQQALLGAILTLVVGQLYDVNKVEFTKETPANIKHLFQRTMNTCKGWIELLRETALMKGKEHLNYPDIFTEDDFEGDKYVGDCIGLKEKLQDVSTPDMQCLLEQGGEIDDFNGLGGPLLVVSSSIFSCIAREYQRLCISSVCENPRLSKRDIGGKKVYYIDDIPVIPITQLNYADKHLKGRTHFAALTVARNISLGTSIGEIRDNDPLNSGMGMIIEKERSVKNHGKYYFLAHALFSSAIANTDMITAAQIYTEAA